MSPFPCHGLKTMRSTLDWSADLAWTVFCHLSRSNDFDQEKAYCLLLDQGCPLALADAARESYNVACAE